MKEILKENVRYTMNASDGVWKKIFKKTLKILNLLILILCDFVKNKY